MITDGKAGKILEVSKSSKNLLGYTPEELMVNITPFIYRKEQNKLSENY